MADDAVRAELEKMWTAVRTAFAEFRLDDALQCLQVPPGAPRPTKEQAKQVADFLPDIRKCRFVRLTKEKDRTAWCGIQGKDAVVFRFDKTAAGWKIAPPPHSSSSVSDDESTPEKLLETHPNLKVFPSD